LRGSATRTGGHLPVHRRAPEPVRSRTDLSSVEALRRSDRSTTFYAWLGRGPSRRALWDAAVTEILVGYYQADEQGRRKPESLYGAAKMWAHLNRQGIPVARCTVERLMRGNGWRGVVRTRKVRTTIPDRAAHRASDLIDRCFAAAAPSQLLVADFTYVRVRAGFVYTAFVIDAFAGLIVGWDVTATANAAMVERALADGLDFRRRQGHPIQPGAVHHSDAGNTPPWPSASSWSSPRSGPRSAQSVTPTTTP
jgi:putative transposase